MKGRRVTGIVLAAAVLISGFSPSGQVTAMADERQSVVDVWDGTTDITWYDEMEPVYEISTAEQLAGFAQLTNDRNNKRSFEGKTIRLMADIDLAGIEWTPIALYGLNQSNSGAFAGIFDGNHHVIRNLTVTGPNRNGLFSSITGGTIQNLGIENAEIVQSDSTFYHGILGAFTSNIKILNCYTTGSVITNEDRVNAGGLIGFVAGKGDITGCYSSANIRAENEKEAGDIYGSLGGIVGAWNGGSYQGSSLISDCYFDGSISNLNGILIPAGILGLDYTEQNGISGLQIKNCFVKPVSVSAPKAPDNFAYIGVMVGIGEISNCYYMEPDEKSDEMDQYLPAFMIEKGDYDPFAEEDVEKMDSMTGTSFVSRLNEKAGQNPRVTWREGVDHPTFSWDKRNIPASFSVTATASNASKALISVVSNMNGKILYAVIGEETEIPSSTLELEQMVSDGECVAGGIAEADANNVVTLSAEGLEADTGYTVLAAVKNEYDLWSRLKSCQFRTTREYLTGAAVISGFPVAGEELTVELFGIREDAEPAFAWYRGKELIDGAEGESYILTDDEIGYKIHAVVTSPVYEGSIVSEATPKIAEEYTVTKIGVTKNPDRMVYGRDETFDRTGMEVTAYLKASASNATPSTARKILSDSEYDTSYNFQDAGKAVVTISYRGADTELEVMVTSENLEGEVVISGFPVAGETLRAELTGAQTEKGLSYFWYRDGIRIDGASGKSYSIRKEDAGHRIRVEVTASQYAGKLVSDPTDTIRSGFTVSHIAVTKMPDKMTYRKYDAFDGAGMEVTAYLRVNALDSAEAAKKVLLKGEYEVSSDFSRSEAVTVIYRWNGAVYTDEFQVTVEAGGQSGSSSGSSGSGRVINGGQQPQSGSWYQTENGSWSFKKANGLSAVSEWIYAESSGKNAWYRFDEKGGLLSGWFEENGKWYYLNPEHDGFYGAMRTGWLLAEDGYWYYLNPQDGVMVTGWTEVERKRYYFNPVGYNRTWLPDGNGGWKWTGSTAMPYGAMYADTVTPDGMKVGADGARIE